ncbi:MAG: hypothetical protein H7Z43_01570 [Clostridia bacterium]|nr:hypothetical protein [Deltaproteobacteria bacterium]
MNLHDATDDQREAFDTQMDGQDWLKVPKSQSSYAANFPNADDQAVQNLVQVAVDCVTMSARACKIERFDAAVHIGRGIPSLFSGP